MAEESEEGAVEKAVVDSVVDHSVKISSMGANTCHT